MTLREPVYVVTIYESDDSTVLTTFTTDPAGTRPHLKIMGPLGEQEIDFRKGKASIGQTNVEIIDVPTDPEDQQSGYFTSILADPTGESQLLGHRFRIQEDVGSGLVNVSDGIIYGLRQVDRVTTYMAEIRDIRERERKFRAFDDPEAHTATIVPRGVLDGYGIPYDGAPEEEWLVPPTKPLTATFHEVEADGVTGESRGFLDLYADLWPGLLVRHSPWELVVSEQMEEALFSSQDLGPDEAPLGSETGRPMVYDKVKVLWRAAGTADPWKEIIFPSAQWFHAVFVTFLGSFAVVEEARAPNGDKVNAIKRIYFDNHHSPDGAGGVVAMPADQESIDFIVSYRGLPTESWPVHWEGTSGELLDELYQGLHSLDPPNMRYDQAAVLALNTPIRLRLDEKIDNLREWTEKNIYSVSGAAPALNLLGEISPVTYHLPPDGATLVTLDESNCEFGETWSHNAQSAVNIVGVEYVRDYFLSPSQDPGGRLAKGDSIATRKVSVRYQSPESIALIGPEELTLKPVTLRSLGTADGQPFTGDVQDEVGASVAAERNRNLLDRFRFGGQAIQVTADRTDPDVEGLRNGDWVILDLGWHPDYQSRKKGGQRLAQVISRRNENSVQCLLGLIDAGPNAQPLVQPPALGTLTQTDGIVTVPVESMPAEGDVRIDYAIVASGAAEPAETSDLWRFLARVDAVQDVLTPVIPGDRRVWVRHRTELEGRRPSTWVSPGSSIEIPAVPRLQLVTVTPLPDGTVNVRWRTNATTTDIRLRWEGHDGSTPPETVDEGGPQDVLESTDEYTIPASEVTGNFMTVEVEPWDGTPDGAGNTAGNKMQRTVRMADATAGAGGAGTPIVLKDHLEGIKTGTVWWRYIETGLNVVDQKIRTQVGDGAISAQVDPTREEGEASTVNGGNLGADEGEHDVTLHQSRMTKIYLDLILANGHTHTELLVGLDRNKTPDFVSLFEQDLVIHVLADADTLSHKVVEDGGGYDSGIQAGHFSDHDVSAEVPLDTQSVFTVTLYAGPNGTGTSVSRQITVVNGTVTSGSIVTWEADDPAPDTDVAEFTLQCADVDAGDTIEILEETQCDGQGWNEGSNSSFIKGSLDPSYSDPPPEVETVYDYDLNGVVHDDDTSDPHNIQYRWTLELRDSGGNLKDSAVAQIGFIGPMCPAI